MSRRYVVLDRDGTIIVERNYLSSPEQVELLPGAAEGMKRLAALGYGLVIVTNQSGIGRGYFTREALEQVHARMMELLAANGAAVEAIYVCPHAPDDECNCRKPKPALLEQAAADLGFTESDCIVVGDKPSDIDLGKAVGARTALVRTGYGAKNEGSVQADWVVDDLVGLSQRLR